MPARNSDAQKIVVQLGETKPEEVIAPAPVAVAEKPVDTMAPTLVESPTMPTMNFDPKPAFPAVQEPAVERFTLEIKPEEPVAVTPQPTPSPIPTHVPMQPVAVTVDDSNDNGMQLVMKSESQMAKEPAICIVC